MLIILFAISSAVLFGAFAVLLRVGLNEGGDALLAAVTAIAIALVVAVVVLLVNLAQGATVRAGDIWPFFLAGAFSPGLVQLLFTAAIREVGAARTSIVVSTAPLVAVALALTFLNEPLEPALLVGALLIVGGALALTGERSRPAHLRLIGLVLAFAAACLIAGRNVTVRALAVEGDLSLGVSLVATLAGALIVLIAWTTATRGRSAIAALGKNVRLFAPAGLAFGLSCMTLFAAYFGGRVSVVSPLVATESLFAVGFSILMLRATEMISRRVILGALLVVAGGALIGVSS